MVIPGLGRGKETSRIFRARNQDRKIKSQMGND